jgi:hypothetical protein
LGLESATAVDLKRKSLYSHGTAGVDEGEVLLSVLNLNERKAQVSLGLIGKQAPLWNTEFRPPVAHVSEIVPQHIIPKLKQRRSLFGGETRR